MHVVFKKIRTFCIVTVLSVSLTVSNTAAVTYQAAAIPVVYTGWQTLVTIFALLGITICAAPDISEDESAQELLDAFAGWRVLNGEGQGDNDGDGEDDVYSFDPLSYLFGNKLTIPEEDLELWQRFIADQDYTLDKNPISDVNLYGTSIDEFSFWLCDLYGIDYNSDNYGASYLNNFVNTYYDGFVANNYSGLWGFYYDSKGNLASYYYPLSSGLIRYGERSVNNPSQHILYCNTSKMYAKCFLTADSSAFIKFSNSSVTSWYYPYYSGLPNGDFDFDILIINGRQYDLDSLCSKPANLTTDIDYGTSFSLSDFVVPTNHFGSSISDVINSVSGVNLGSLVESGDFDVIGGDRIYDEDLQEAVGDITVTMPSPEIIEDFSNGDVSYEDMAEEMEVIPINEAAGTNLLTQEFLTTQTGIFNGVTGILDLLQQIVSWLNNLIDSIVQAFIDMLLSLFVPTDGFIDGKIGQIQAKLDSLGVAPFDMSGIFDSDDGNPFQNIVIDVNGQEVVIVSFDFLPPFLDKFRPVIRGLLVLLLVYYSINQLLSLIRLSGMMEGGNVNQLSIQGSSVSKIEDKGGKL